MEMVGAGSAGAAQTPIARIKSGANDALDISKNWLDAVFQIHRALNQPRCRALRHRAGFAIQKGNLRQRRLDLQVHNSPHISTKGQDYASVLMAIWVSLEACEESTTLRTLAMNACELRQ